MTVAIPERIKESFLKELLEMYAEGEISAGKAARAKSIKSFISTTTSLNTEEIYNVRV